MACFFHRFYFPALWFFKRFFHRFSFPTHVLKSQKSQAANSLSKYAAFPLPKCSEIALKPPDSVRPQNSSAFLFPPGSWFFHRFSCPGQGPGQWFFPMVFSPFFLNPFKKWYEKKPSKNYKMVFFVN